MSEPIEYLFAVSFHAADQAARKQGWLGRGRSDWLKPDGAAVYFICLQEQLEAVPAGVTVYVVGGEPSWLRGNKRKLVRLAA
jgi:hypothetical protein